MHDNVTIQHIQASVNGRSRLPSIGLVCFVQDRLYDPAGEGWTGTHLQNYQVARALRDVGFAVAFLVVTSTPEVIPAIYDTMTVRHVRVTDRLPFAAGWSQVQSALAELHPDIIYTRGRSWLTGVACSYARKQKVAAIWATNGEDSCERWKFTRRAFRTGKNLPRIAMRGFAGVIEDVLYARGISRAALVINQTGTQQASLKKEFSRDGIVIHSIQDVPPGPFVKADPPVVLWIGQLVAEKRPGLFLDLVEQCSDLDLEFRMIGRLSPSSGIEERLKGLAGNPRFSYLGPLSRDAVHQQMAAASLIVNTSTPGGDGVPNAMVESWMRQTPALSLEIDPDGLIAVHNIGIVCGGDTKRMLTAMRKLAGAHAMLREMGERARQVARDEFSAERNARRYSEVLSKFLKNDTATKQ